MLEKVHTFFISRYTLNTYTGAKHSKFTLLYLKVDYQCSLHRSYTVFEKFDLQVRLGFISWRNCRHTSAVRLPWQAACRAQMVWGGHQSLGPLMHLLLPLLQTLPSICPRRYFRLPKALPSCSLWVVLPCLLPLCFVCVLAKLCPENTDCVGPMHLGPTLC